MFSIIYCSGFYGIDHDVEEIDFEQVNFYYFLNSDKPRRLVKDCYSNHIFEQRPKSTLDMGQII